MDEEPTRPGATGREEAAARIGRVLGRRARAIAQRTAEYAIEHEDEVRRAGATAAHLAVNRAAPPLLRPLLHGAAEGLAKPRAPGPAEKDTPPAP